MSENEHTLGKVDELRVDALYGKKKHYTAADRKDLYNKYLGIPAVAITILLGSVLFASANNQIPEVMRWIGASLAFVASALTGLQTFFNFQKQAEGHRRIGSRYLAVAKECSRIRAYFLDGNIDQNALRKQLEDLAQQYAEITRDAEAFPTSPADYRITQKGLNEGEERYTENELHYKGE